MTSYEEEQYRLQSLWDQIISEGELSDDDAIIDPSYEDVDSSESSEDAPAKRIKNDDHGQF